MKKVAAMVAFSVVLMIGFMFPDLLSPVKRSPFSNGLGRLACNSSNSERKMETRRLSF